MDCFGDNINFNILNPHEMRYPRSQIIKGIDFYFDFNYIILDVHLELLKVEFPVTQQLLFLSSIGKMIIFLKNIF